MIPYSLDELAKFQLQFSQQYCLDECKSYHSSWAILRANELVGGIDSDKQIYLDIIHNLFQSDKKITILIAGCADSGILNMILSSNLQNYEIDMVDRCETPLQSCHRLINSHNNIHTLQSDLLLFKPTKKYDLIVCHSLLPFFDDNGRKKLLKNFSLWLKKEGKIVVSLREKTTSHHHNSIEEKALLAYEKIKNTPYLKNTHFSFEDLKKYYTIIANQNLPYQGFEEGIKEFQENDLKVISTIYGGVGISFSSNYIKPRSLIFVASQFRLEN